MCTAARQVWWLCFAVSAAEMLVLAVRSPLGYLSNTWRMADMVLVGVQGHYGHTLQRPGASPQPPPLLLYCVVADSLLLVADRVTRVLFVPHCLVGGQAPI